MPVAADPSTTWQAFIVAFVTMAILAFLVTWTVTDLAHVSRTPYIGVLALMTLSLTAGYLAWSGTSLVPLVDEGWLAAVGAGLLAAAAIAPGVRRLPSQPRLEGSRLGARLAWEGVVYGTAEALLLATLPVLTLWQAADALGWTDTTLTKIGSGALAIGGALVVIGVHHLGYREFRGLAARKKLLGAFAACGVQALAFLVTGNVLAPLVAHILLHGQMILRGVELPPVAKSLSSSRRFVPDAPVRKTHARFAAAQDAASAR